MRPSTIGCAIVLAVALLSISHADVRRSDELIVRLTSRLEVSDVSVGLKIEDGDTISHLLYAIKLKLGSRISLYGNGGLVDRYRGRKAVAGQSLSVPLSIFDVDPTEQQTSRQSGLTVRAPADTKQGAVEKDENLGDSFSPWEIGYGFGFTRIDGEDRSDGSRAAFISKLSQRLSIARNFRLNSDIEIGSRFRLMRVDFESDALSVQLRRSFDLLAAFAMSFEKKWDGTSLAFSFGAEESLFYFSRTGADITIDSRATAVAELRIASQIFDGNHAGLFVETFGKMYSGSDGTNYSAADGFGFGAAFRVKDFESGSSCGIEYGVRQQPTNILLIVQPSFDLECAVRF